MKTRFFTAYFVLWLTMLSFVSSCNYLDYEEGAITTEELVFTDYHAARAFIVRSYSDLPASFNHIDGAMSASMTDDAEHAWDYSRVQLLNNGSWGQFDNNPDDIWTSSYQKIRRINKFIESTDTLTFSQFQYVDPNNYEQFYRDINNFRIEARFLRAFYYFELIKRYGAVPITLSPMGLGDESSIVRNDFKECVDVIIKDLDYAIRHLPLTRSSEETSRATKGAALALKCRVLLYAASPLYNNGIYDQELCKRSAEAGIELLNLNRYSLSASYQSLFTSFSNTELIFERRDGQQNTFEKYNFPVSFEGGGIGVTCPSQNLVDSYEMQATGKLPFEVGSGYDSNNPYEGRDPRLGYTVIWNNASFKGVNIEIWEGGKDGKGTDRATKTGYYLRKYVNPAVDFTPGGSQITVRHAWYYFRLAEVYLNIAEALNEAFGPSSTEYGISAIRAINMVRNRGDVSMPAIDNAISKEDFTQKVRNERRVELAFEGHREWDVRRWKIAENTLGAPLRGMQILRNGGDFNYIPYEVERREFSEKMYYYPIPQQEISQTNLIQNPLW